MTVPVREFTAENIRDLPDFYRSIQASIFSPKPFARPKPAPVVVNHKPEPEPIVGLYALPFKIYPSSGMPHLRLLNILCIRYGVTVAELKSPRRARRVCLARQIAMYLMLQELGWSLPNISRRLGGRDHTTALHGIRKIKRMIDESEEFREEVEEIAGIFRAGNKKPDGTSITITSKLIGDLIASGVIDRDVSKLISALQRIEAGDEVMS